ncbi:MAG: hypothetical protein J6X35_03735, partial [Bacteroidales bacterium]|nr:hypothetical protein [Bacteroidales bacterium]
MKKLFLLVLLGVGFMFVSNAQTPVKQGSVSGDSRYHETYKSNLQHPYFQFKLPKQDFRCFFETSKIIFGTDDSIPPLYIFYFDTSDFDMEKSYFYASYVTAQDNPKLFANYTPYDGYPFAYNKFVNSCRIDEAYHERRAMKWCEKELQQGRLVSISIVRIEVRKGKDGSGNRREASSVQTNGRKLEHYAIVYYM